MSLGSGTTMNLRYYPTLHGRHAPASFCLRGQASSVVKMPSRFVGSTANILPTLNFNAFWRLWQVHQMHVHVHDICYLLCCHCMQYHFVLRMSNGHSLLARIYTCNFRCNPPTDASSDPYRLCLVCLVSYWISEGFTPETSPHGNDKVVKLFFPTLPSTQAGIESQGGSQGPKQILALSQIGLVVCSMLQALANYHQTNGRSLTVKGFMCNRSRWHCYSTHLSGLCHDAVLKLVIVLRSLCKKPGLLLSLLLFWHVTGNGII